MAREKQGPKPYGYSYQNAVIEAAEIMGLKFGPLSVLKCLVKHCNGDSGQARPSKDTLATLGGQGLRTVKRHLRTLEDTGLIEPMAYVTGGHARSTVYKFGLPMWSSPRAPKNSAKTAWLKEQRQTYGANLSTYGAILSTYGAKLAPQQRRTEEETGEEEKAAASRGAGLSDASGVCPESGRPDRPSAFREWDGDENYSQYLDEKKAWENGALRAAEN
ncbi:helix-turn-helix domain-containing protein [Cognatiyoonia sp. IB215182]|uniref:helix-turn-helix domain-containing protein n=1 Tax=Cognatiyoonia sp. IB215182 TaxID=3097353 RepID=UPI002A1654F7|nr:helix-turn-helix domain-containing protein [Cognatiyoonia sp. IB215182]MDX8353674.1 helix-turn-helix domain-containing protein [Cognatiyoonia sp. IB215182]